MQAVRSRSRLILGSHPAPLPPQTIYTVKANVGRTKRLSAVEVKRPPKITIAIGPSISRPASPDPKASGSSPSAVTNAVMQIGVNRSLATVPLTREQRFPTPFGSCEMTNTDLTSTQETDSRRANSSPKFCRVASQSSTWRRSATSVAPRSRNSSARRRVVLNSLEMDDINR